MMLVEPLGAMGRTGAISRRILPELDARRACKIPVVTPDKAHAPDHRRCRRHSRVEHLAERDQGRCCWNGASLGGGRADGQSASLDPEQNRGSHSEGDEPEAAHGPSDKV